MANAQLQEAPTEFSPFSSKPTYTERSKHITTLERNLVRNIEGKYGNLIDTLIAFTEVKTIDNYTGEIKAKSPGVLFVPSNDIYSQIPSNIYEKLTAKGTRSIAGILTQDKTGTTKLAFVSYHIEPNSLIIHDIAQSIHFEPEIVSVLRALTSAENTNNYRHYLNSLEKLYLLQKNKMSHVLVDFPRGNTWESIHKALFLGNDMQRLWWIVPKGNGAHRDISSRLNDPLGFASAIPHVHFRIENTTIIRPDYLLRDYSDLSYYDLEHLNYQYGEKLQKFYYQTVSEKERSASNKHRHRR